MQKLKYIKGDATNPISKGEKIICHICNDIGSWGKGFVLAISKRWKEPEIEYRKWYREKNNFLLGEVQFIRVEQYITVANMIGQHGIKTSSKDVPIRYDAVEKCLEKVCLKAKELNASVHMPRIGCGLAGGKWEKIEPIIIKTLVANDIEVFVYDL
ncbi:macro domain-containing protein [Acetivibrio clariflavus]|uniref:Putative phosphatase, C-terminal domain of histone macro H2A1 like protein n=1 Tax=Acetivibrio clariflavus (strain DSM 19732 / NBRC 101661 / EBR45) TaxID=720554 RepID=G8M249_ACECE|nr:macro domain-containing protein [Acetivibrio clariflavus]AEV68167.1 putative phosphatase, C-terminal domain of histone macro H2A1 like protein [Acetivibrio clariflavus DSM 19732]